MNSRGMIYQLKNKKFTLIHPSNTMETLSSKQLYLKKIDDEYSLVINSFRNKIFIFNNSLIEENSVVIYKNMKEDFLNPIDNSQYFTPKTLYSEQLEIDTNKRIDISLAITYDCNLKCSYCFQQKYGKLKKTPITSEDLERVLSNISLIKKENPELIISMSLFGGEPLLPKNEPIIARVFDYCCEHEILVSIVTNGVFLPYFAKKLIIYRSIISNIAVTINSLPEIYKEITKITRVANNAKKLLEVVNVLLSYGINISVGTNFDRTNISYLTDMFKYFNENEYFNKKNFNWNIGRVDDRFFESGYDDFIISETEIIKEIMKIKTEIPSNMRAAFMQATKNLTDAVDLSFNEAQIKGKYNYCWNNSPYEKVFYIDNDLNFFRCTVTVGRPEYILGNLNETDLISYKNKDITFLDNENCKKCIIGGFCSGGCEISAKTNFFKQCDWEKKQFDNFIDEIFIPKIKELSNEAVIKR